MSNKLKMEEKHIMKKLSLVLALLMLCVLAFGCAQPAAEPAAAPATEPAAEPAAEPAEPAAEPPAEPAAEDDLAYIKGKGSMTIGYTVYAPMNYTDDNGVFTGFDTELATAVCEKLGVTPNFQEINWETKEVELNGKTIDCIWNGMTLDADREANMACTDPYVKNAQVVVMKAGSGYTDTASLIGKTVVAEIGSAGETTIKDDANLSQADYVGKGVQTDCLMEVQAGTAAAAVLDMTLAKAMIGEGTDYADLEIVDELAIEFYGVGFRKGSNVRDEVNKIFDEMVADGSLKALADKYSLEIAE